MSFEEAFAKLNKILEEFENGEVSLETSISLYEEGMLLKIIVIKNFKMLK